MRAGFDHGSLNDPHQATVNLANLTHIRHADTVSSTTGNIRLFSRTRAATHKVITQPVFLYLNHRQMYNYHSITAITGQDDDINGRGVVGDTDSSILGFVFTKKKKKKKEHEVYLYWVRT